MKKIETVCVYCGSSDDVNPVYMEAARAMGTALAGRGLSLVFGAGKTGLMGAVADAALEAGGQVTGIMPVMFNTPQLVHDGLTRLEIVDTIQHRKARMAELADAFVALPGGFGTYEELFEILTWAQIGLHKNPIGVLNVNHYFDPLLTLIQHAKKEGFIYHEHAAFLAHADRPDVLLDQLANHEYPDGLERWVERNG